jgi:hypothetical protein
VLACARCLQVLLDAPLSSVIRTLLPPEEEGPASRPPPDGWSWLALLRRRGGGWQAIAKADSVGAAWDAALSSWQRGDLLVMPARPLAGKTDATSHEEPTP